MPKINKIENTKTYKKPIINPKNTGYLAASAVGLSAIRAFSNQKSITRSHKVIGYFSIALTLLHIGCIEYLRHKYKKL